jgi:hypothetical protein
MRIQHQMGASGLLGTAMCALALVLASGGSAGADPGSSSGNAPIHQPTDHQPPGRSKQDTLVPQPPSKTDFSGHGGNVHWPDDSPREGSPSGKGNREAVGKPCTGCAGKAANKKPPGHKPNRSDRSAATKCGPNHGTGRTSPAHTGCRLKPPPTPQPPPAAPAEGEVASPDVPVRPAAPPKPVTVSASPISEVTASTLADTGPVLAVPLIAAGLAACVGGAILLHATRRRSTRTDC